VAVEPFPRKDAEVVSEIFCGGERTRPGLRFQGSRETGELQGMGKRGLRLKVHVNA